jgi:CDP-glucose 4,6-dehydratase
MLVDPAHWAGRRVLVTGHTGFKGAWLSLWLHEMGAEVTGLALAAEQPSLFEQAGLGTLVHHVEGDIRDPETVDRVVAAAQPQTVFHLAAQPLVRLSYEQPRETFATNVQGTVHVLDACRRVAGLEAIVAVTSDKCYENREWVWPYRETDPMGGHDPYSASKGAAELVIAAYRASFFNEGKGTLLASVRAGNVIGGGDWARDRLIPDIIRSMIEGRRVLIRAPHSVRPWQHVLEALGGYLLIAQHLAMGDRWAASAWNFGPPAQDARAVSWIVERMIAGWGSGACEIDRGAQPHEAKMLKLDCSKALTQLGWRPALDLSQSIAWIIDWHKALHEGGDALALSRQQLTHYRTLMNRALREDVPK